MNPDRPAADHAAFRLLAAAAVDGHIDPPDAATLEAHLATCATCRADQDAMFADHAWLASPGRAAPPGARVRAAVLDAARSPRVPRFADSQRAWPGLAAAALVVALVAGGALLASQTVPPFGSAPSPTPAMSLEPTASAGVVTPAAGICAPLPDGLTGWWRGEDAADVFGNDGRTRGALRFTPGLVGNALTFDGSTAYVEVPYGAALDVGTGDFTLMLWVRFASLEGEQVMVERWHDTGGGAAEDAGWSLGKAVTNEIYAAVASNGANAGAGTRATTSRLQVETWYHIAVRRQANVLLLILNGATVGGNDRLVGSFDLGLERPLLFGRRGDDRELLLHGQLDEIKLVVGRALFESDIRADFLAGSTGACPA